MSLRPRQCPDPHCLWKDALLETSFLVESVLRRVQLQAYNGPMSNDLENHTRWFKAVWDWGHASASSRFCPSGIQQVCERKVLWVTKGKQCLAFAFRWWSWPRKFLFSGHFSLQLLRFFIWKLSYYMLNSVLTIAFIHHSELWTSLTDHHNNPRVTQGDMENSSSSTEAGVKDATICSQSE